MKRAAESGEDLNRNAHISGQFGFAVQTCIKRKSFPLLLLADLYLYAGRLCDLARGRLLCCTRCHTLPRQTEALLQRSNRRWGGGGR